MSHSHNADMSHTVNRTPSHIDGETLVPGYDGLGAHNDAKNGMHSLDEAKTAFEDARKALIGNEGQKGDGIQLVEVEADTEEPDDMYVGGVSTAKSHIGSPVSYTDVVRKEMQGTYDAEVDGEYKDVISASRPDGKGGTYTSGPIESPRGAEIIRSRAAKDVQATLAAQRAPAAHE